MLIGDIKMKVVYVAHSCFVVETENFNLIFDYFEGSLPKLNKEKKLIFFVSHHHHDHYNQAIYDFKEVASYVLSSDIWHYPKEKSCSVKPNIDVEFEGLKITTLKSNDIGVAFVVEVDGKRIYHAGDLNAWMWTPLNEQENLDNIKMEEDYREQLNLIRSLQFDLAFVPLDPRLDEFATRGMVIFNEIIDAKVVFPMHMWKDYSIINKAVSHDCAKWFNKIAEITTENQVFEI